MKPKEFWIQNPQYEISTATKTFAFDPEVNPQITEEIHVIEFSAYQALEARHKKLLEVLNNQIKRGYPTGGEWSAIENEVKKAGREE